MSESRQQLIKVCETKLKKLKKDYLDIISEDYEFRRSDKFYRNQHSIFKKARIRNTLPQISKALLKIKLGTYGVCEKTGEEIESQRLLAVPWTNISLKAL
ncbi:MAG: hypothetical protein CME69_06070 [Halobacteriovorax sp.]|nr:hypothetical protein [Halobacteriovorax sp.]|tara:strand:+ start:1645 stop:1944 length:300 start_codon:yes stop_codon:yes gene_type:complete